MEKDGEDEGEDGGGRTKTDKRKMEMRDKMEAVEPGQKRSKGDVSCQRRKIKVHTRSTRSLAL